MPGIDPGMTEAVQARVRRVLWDSDPPPYVPESKKAGLAARPPDRKRRWHGGSVLGALGVGAVLGQHDDAGANADMRGDEGADAIRQDRRLVGGRGGLTLGHRLGLDHF